MPAAGNKYYVRIHECGGRGTPLDAAAEKQLRVFPVETRDVTRCVAVSCLQSVKKTGRLVVTHEAPLTNGFGAEIASTVQVSHQRRRRRRRRWQPANSRAVVDRSVGQHGQQHMFPKGVVFAATLSCFALYLQSCL